MLRNHPKRLWLVIMVGLVFLGFVSNMYWNAKKAAETELVHTLQTNPRFSLSASDLELFDATIKALEANQQAFAAYYEGADQTFIETSLYPTVFWHNLYETEQLRRAVIATPNQHSIEQYFSALEETARSYHAYIEAIKPVLQKSPEKQIGYLDGVVHVDTLVAWLTKIQNASDTTVRWIETQRECLLPYKQAECVNPAPETEFPLGTIVSSTTDTDARDFALHFAHVELSAVASPSLVLGPSFNHHGRCSLDETIDTAQLWQGQSRKNDLPFVRFTYIDELLFRDHTTPDTPYSVFLRSHGVPYQFQPVNHYLCAQFGYDAATLATLAFMSESAVDSRSLLMKDKSAHYPELLATLDHHTDFTLHVFSQTDKPSVSELLLTHGALSLTLLPFNNTITDAPFPIQTYPDTKTQLHLLRYPDDLAKVYPTYTALTAYLDQATAILKTLTQGEVSPSN